MSLPSGYKRLEYIQSSGTQYIDTGVAANGNTGFAVDFSTTSAVSTSGYGSILGCLNSGSNRYGISTYPDRSGGQLCYGSAIYNPYITVGNRLQVSLLNGSIKTPNGTETVGAQTFNVGATITVFGRKRTDGSVDELSKTKIYALTIYDNGNLVRDFIPCQKPDGTNGLWDDVNSVFYANAGTGTFTAGPEIIPDPPAAPTGLQTVLAVVMQWAASESADRYDVYRDGAKLGSTATTQYVDATPEANQTYGYTVKAVNAGGESAGTSITVYTKRGYF